MIMYDDYNISISSLIFNNYLAEEAYNKQKLV